MVLGTKASNSTEHFYPRDWLKNNCNIHRIICLYLKLTICSINSTSMFTIRGTISLEPCSPEIQITCRQVL